MEGYIIKFDDGKYMSVNHRHGKGNWEEKHIYSSKQNADDYVKSQQEHKRIFIQYPVGYVKGITPEYFDCKVVKLTVTEQ